MDMPLRSRRSQPELGADDVTQLCAALLTASRALVGVAARSMAEVEATVTLQQYRALVVLAQHGELRVGELAEALALHASTVSRLCDRLADKGLIHRRPSHESRREVVLSLSADGTALLHDVTERRRSEIAGITRRMPVATRSGFIEALEAFAEAAGELPDEAWKLGW